MDIEYTKLNSKEMFSYVEKGIKGKFFFANNLIDADLFNLIYEYLEYIADLVNEEDEKDFTIDDFSTHTIKVLNKALDYDTFEEYWNSIEWEE